MRLPRRASGPLLVLGSLVLMLACPAPAHAGPTVRADAGVRPTGHGAAAGLAQAPPDQAPQDPRLGALFAKARAGDPAAQNRLGEKFAHGEDVERDLAEASRWYRLAAEEG